MNPVPLLRECTTSPSDGGSTPSTINSVSASTGFTAVPVFELATTTRDTTTGAVTLTLTGADFSDLTDLVLAFLYT